MPAVTLEKKSRRGSVIAFIAVLAVLAALALGAGRLDALSPLKKLGGGYGYVTDEADRRIVSVAQIDVGTRIRVRLRDGCLKARVEEAKGGDSFAQKEDGRGEGDPHSTGGEPRH